MSTKDMPHGCLLSSLIVSELKEIGIKHKEKKIKIVQLTDAFLANGTVVQVPKFVAEACSNILEQVDVEGLFRKAGSAAKQREIRKCLEAGLPLDKSHRVIDIANILSYFFRELPEPLIPTYIHETLVRCLLTDESNRIRALQLACLLPPTLTVHTLAYFMQFLHTVSAHATINKMSAENLAIVLAPSIMPHPDINSVRFKNHLRLVQLLIQNANKIGTIPTHINDILRSSIPMARCPVESLQTPQRQINSDSGAASKKKKRRSDVFNGLRKIVGNAIGSSENLDCSIETNSAKNRLKLALHKQASPFPAISSHKRKFTDPVSAFSAKKKKDILAPSSTGPSECVPNAPQIKEKKHPRISLGGSRQIKNCCSNGATTASSSSAMERRWSLVSTGWAKYKKKEVNSNKSNFFIEEKEHILDEDEFPPPPRYVVHETQTNNNSDEIRISKSEYEDIKQRVTDIETQISEQLLTVEQKVMQNSLPRKNDLTFVDGPESVQTKYEKIVKETETLNCLATDQLAHRLSKGLKIRRSIERQVIRSPSARKIGTLRRRSQERSRITRTKTWHISGSNLHNVEPTSNVQCGDLKDFPARRSSTKPVDFLTPAKKQDVVETEQWMSAEKFFQTVVHQPSSLCRDMEEKSISQLHNSILCTPSTAVKSFSTLGENSNFQTPMLPPKSVPRRYGGIRTPISVAKAAQNNKLGSINRIVASTPNEGETGRASIARLRTQHAGMVMAKAKLFDGLSGSSGASSSSRPTTDFYRDRMEEKPEIQTPLTHNRKMVHSQMPRESPKGICKRTIINKKPQMSLLKQKALIDEIMKENVVVASKSRTSRVSKDPTFKASPRKFHQTNGSHFNSKNFRNSPQANKSKQAWK